MIPSYEEIMLPLLKCVGDGKIYTNKECETYLQNFFQLTTDELQARFSSKGKKRIFSDRINWAKTYLKKANILEVTEKRGEFRITQRGKEILKENISILNNKYLKQYPEFVSFVSLSNENNLKEKTNVNKNLGNEENTDTPIEKLEKSYDTLNNMLKDELLEKLKSLDFCKFEEVVIDLIIKMGYGGSKTEISKSLTKKSNDEGIDGVINEDRLGFDSIYLQAKRWKDTTVGRPEVQKFVGALAGQRATKGIFITTSNFTKEAVNFCNNLTPQKIVLIDGKKLVDLMIEFSVGLYTEQVYEIKKIDLDYFLDE